MVDLTTSLQVCLQRTPSFKLSIVSEFAVSDYQYYFCTVLLNIVMTICNLDFTLKQIYDKAFVSKGAF